MKSLIRILLWLIAPSIALFSCGYSGHGGDRYTETIYAEDFDIDPGYEELSDTELISEDETDADTAMATDSIAGTDSIMPDLIAEDAAVLKPRSSIRLRNIGRLHEVFNDSNHQQLQHAQRLGITPMHDLSSYYNTRRPLVKIESNDDFIVDELRHSYPYLVPEASALLHDIGRNFRDSLRSRNAGDYRIIVTSVLRTPVTVKRLRRVNGNATQESTHQFGTTFDITYTRFQPVGGRDINTQGDLKNLLGEVLFDLHQEGRCMIKYERKSPCFHITVVR